MSILSSSGHAGSQPATLSARRFTLDEYHHLLQAGTLTEDDAVELLEGLVVSKVPHNPPHDIALELADELLRPWLPTGWRLRIQSAITTADSEPEPDLAIVRGEPRTRRTRHPGPQEIGLLIEVADTTLTRDRLEKQRLYARAGIACYWILNLQERQIEIYTDPTGPHLQPSYQQRRDLQPADLVPLVIDGQELARIQVADFVP